MLRETNGVAPCPIESIRRLFVASWKLHFIFLSHYDCGIKEKRDWILGQDFCGTLNLSYCRWSGAICWNGTHWVSIHWQRWSLSVCSRYFGDIRGSKHSVFLLLPSCGSFYTLHSLFKRGRSCSNFRPSVSLLIQRAFPEVTLATKFLGPVDSHCYC